MTVISTAITKTWTIHCTDSLLRQRNRATAEVAHAIDYKFARVSKFRGAMSWFGRIYNDVRWDAPAFLRDMSSSAATDIELTPDNFAREIADRLNMQQSLLKIRGTVAMGIHFSFYEQVDDLWLPELYLITNYTGITNTGEYVLGSEFVAQRQTYFTLTHDTQFNTHHERDKRLAVNAALQQKEILYNNGNPAMFNATAAGISTSVNYSKGKGFVDTADPISIAGNLALQQIEIIADIQEKFFRTESQLVGRPCYYLLIKPDGEIHSNLNHTEIPGT